MGFFFFSSSDFLNTHFEILGMHEIISYRERQTDRNHTRKENEANFTVVQWEPISIHSLTFHKHCLHNCCMLRCFLFFSSLSLQDKKYNHLGFAYKLKLFMHPPPAHHLNRIKSIASLQTDVVGTDIRSKLSTMIPNFSD